MCANFSKQNISGDQAYVPRHTICFTSVQTNVAAVRIIRQWDEQTLQQHQRLMDWLSPSDFPEQHDIISRRVEGTRQWFLESAEFKARQPRAKEDPFLLWYSRCWQDHGSSDCDQQPLQRSAKRRHWRCGLVLQLEDTVEQSSVALLATLLKQLVQS